MMRLVLLALCAALPAADLVFVRSETDLFIEPQVTTAVARFPCRNSGTAPVAVGKVDYGCSCTGFRLLVEGRSATAVPAGAEAVVELDVSVVGGVSGSQWKGATFAFGGALSEERHRLGFSYRTSERIQLSRKVLYWDLGQAAQVQDCIFSVAAAEAPIRIRSATCADPFFSVAVTAVEEGRRYAISVTPAATVAAHHAEILVETDSPFAQWRSFTLFCLVTKVNH